MVEFVNSQVAVGKKEEEEEKPKDTINFHKLTAWNIQKDSFRT